MISTGAWSFWICVYLHLLSHLSFFSMLIWVIYPFYIHYLHPSMADKVILITLIIQIGLSGRRKLRHSFCSQALMELLIPRKSQLGWRLLVIGLQRITKCMHTFSFLLSQITVPLLSTSNLVKKLGWRLLPSMRRTVPWGAWHFTNDSICSCMTLPLLLCVYWCHLFSCLTTCHYWS